MSFCSNGRPHFSRGRFRQIEFYASPEQYNKCMYVAYTQEVASERRRRLANTHTQSVVQFPSSYRLRLVITGRYHCVNEHAITTKQWVLYGVCGLTHSPWQRARLVCHFYKCEQCSRSDDTSVANACAKRSPTLAVCVLPSNETERSRVCNWHVFVHASHAYDKHTHTAPRHP